MDHYVLVHDIYILQKSCTVNDLYFKSYIQVGFALA